jgi:hypothetical protein
MNCRDVVEELDRLTDAAEDAFSKKLTCLTMVKGRFVCGHGSQ